MRTFASFKTDPFRSVSQLSEEEKQTARNQTVPSLLQLLELAKQHNISVIFDLYRTHKDGNDREDTAAIIDTIRKSNINPGLVSRIHFKSKLKSVVMHLGV